MTSATEMMYMPFNEDVRYLGKELVKFFGGKLGKSGSSLTLSALNAQFLPTLHVQSLWAVVLALTWSATMYHLSMYLHYKHPDSLAAAHKKDDDAPLAGDGDNDNDELLILSNTTSESNLSVLSDGQVGMSLEEFVDGDLGLEGISPPEGWIDGVYHDAATFHHPHPAHHTHTTAAAEQKEDRKTVRFQTPSAMRRENSSANISRTSDASLGSASRSTNNEHKNYFLRIGSTHVSLHSLGGLGDTGEEAIDTNPHSAGIFAKTGFYW
jgi:hypothetical protein